MARMPVTSLMLPPRMFDKTGDTPPSLVVVCEDLISAFLPDPSSIQPGHCLSVPNFR